MPAYRVGLRVTREGEISSEMRYYDLVAPDEETAIEMASFAADGDGFLLDDQDDEDATVQLLPEEALMKLIGAPTLFPEE